MFQLSGFYYKVVLQGLFSACTMLFRTREGVPRSMYLRYTKGTLFK